MEDDIILSSNFWGDCHRREVAQLHVYTIKQNFHFILHLSKS